MSFLNKGPFCAPGCLQRCTFLSAGGRDCPCRSQGSAVPEMPAQAQLGRGAPESIVARGKGANTLYDSGSVNNVKRRCVSAGFLRLKGGGGRARPQAAGMPAEPGWLWLWKAGRAAAGREESWRAGQGAAAGSCLPARPNRAHGG